MADQYGSRCLRSGVVELKEAGRNEQKSQQKDYQPHGAHFNTNTIHRLRRFFERVLQGGVLCVGDLISDCFLCASATSAPLR
jgi:hypothetical protein